MDSAATMPAPLREQLQSQMQPCNDPCNTAARAAVDSLAAMAALCPPPSRLGPLADSGDEEFVRGQVAEAIAESQQPATAWLTRAKILVGQLRDDIRQIRQGHFDYFVSLHIGLAEWRLANLERVLDREVSP